MKFKNILIIFSILVLINSSLTQAGIFDFLTGKATDNLKYSDIQEALQDFVDNYNEPDDMYVVKGYYSSEIMDVFNVIEIFNNKVFRPDRLTGDINPVLPNITYDSSAPAYSKKGYPTPHLLNSSAQNIIVIGGPCANPLTAQLLNMACEEWPYSPGEAIIKLVNNGDYSAIIIAGTTRGDTGRLANEINNYKTSSKLRSGTEIAFGEATEIGVCGNGICETTENDENCPRDCIDASIQLSFDDKPQIVSYIFEDYIIWGEGPFRTILYNINTKQTKELPTGVQSIYENYILHSGTEKIDNTRGMLVDAPALYIYNTQTGEDKIIANAELRVQFNVGDIYGNKVVYLKHDETYENRKEPWHVYIYDIQTDKTDKLFDIERMDTVLHFDGTNVYYIAPEYCRPAYCIAVEEEVSPDNIVVRPAEEGKPAIGVYNLNTNKKTLITILGRGYGDISVSDNIIAWSDRRTGDGEIYYYDLNTKQEVRVTDQLSHQGSPAVYEGYITWSDSRNAIEESGVSNEDIYMCDITKNGQYSGCLTNDEKIRITVNAKNQGGSKIYGRRIVWTDYRNAVGFGKQVCQGEGDRRICSVSLQNTDIYMYEF